MKESEGDGSDDDEEEDQEMGGDEDQEMSEDEMREVDEEDGVSEESDEEMREVDEEEEMSEEEKDNEENDNEEESDNEENDNDDKTLIVSEDDSQSDKDNQSEDGTMEDVSSDGSLDNEEDSEAEVSAKQPDVAHESDLRWKENLFYRGEEELTRRRVFSNNLMQLVYGDGDVPEDKETDVAAEEETSDDDFFHPKQVAEAMNEAARKNRVVDGLDSEKLDIFPAVKHDWNDESFLAEFKNHFVTGVWGDQLSSESESTSEDEDEGDDAIVDLEEEENEENGEENDEPSGPHDEIISDEELLEDPHVTYNSIEEEREANAAKKAAAREAKEAAEEEAKEVSSDEEKEGKKKEKKEKEEDYFDLLKRKRAEQEEKAKQEFEDVPQAEKDLLLGLPTGTYCRIKLEDVPPAFIRLARPEIPVIVGGLQESEEALGMVRVSLEAYGEA